MTKWRHTPPYDQQFLFKVNSDFAGKSLLDFYVEKFRYKTPEYWQKLIEDGFVSLNHQGVSPETILKIDDEIRTRREDVQEPDVNAEIEILYQDNGLLVLNKKAPIPVHPSGRYFKNSLLTVLKETFAFEKFHTIHRLDKWTTGVLVLATEKTVARHLHQQVEKQSMKKVYGVLAVGDFPKQKFEVNDAIGRVQGAHRGTGANITQAKDSLTEFEFITQKPLNKISLDLTFSDFSETTQNINLLKAVPITGRTNQIRVHIEAKGGYILNDPLYSPQKKQEDERIPFLGLHCREMGFTLPSGQALTIKAPWPNEFLQIFSTIDF